MRFATLGPEGSCHENAVLNYLSHHSIEDSDLVLVEDVLGGLELLRAGSVDYLVQCSAHLNVHLVTEKYHPQLMVTDTFIFPTKEIVLLESLSVERPTTLGLVKATEGYLGDIAYDKFVYETTKPVVGKGLLEGRYDAGITSIDYYTGNTALFRLRKYIGSVLTTWIVYGRSTAFNGSLVGVAQRGFYQPQHGN